MDVLRASRFLRNNMSPGSSCVYTYYSTAKHELSRRLGWPIAPEIAHRLVDELNIGLGTSRTNLIRFQHASPVIRS